MKIVAMFAYCERDKHHLPELMSNLAWCDEIIAYDNTGDDYDEQKMRRAMKQKAIEAGADYILECDPDERFELRTGKVLRKISKKEKSKTIYRFNFRELYEEDKYRIDGSWSRKHRFSFYPVFPDQEMKDKKYNLKTYPINEDYKRFNLGLNLYHLKMIEPEQRKKRVEWLKTIDPNNETQVMYYDYLNDETGLQLETIPKGREYK